MGTNNKICPVTGAAQGLRAARAPHPWGCLAGNGGHGGLTAPLAVEIEETAAEGLPPAARDESPSLSMYIQEQDAIPGGFALRRLLALGLVTVPGP